MVDQSERTEDYSVLQKVSPGSLMELHSTTTYSRTPIKLAKHTFVIPLTALRYELFGETKNVLVDHPYCIPSKRRS